MRDWRIGELFAGIGGIGYGLELGGIGRVAWQVECEPYARRVLEARFGVPIYEDVRTVNYDEVEPVEVLCGGFPCQDLSRAGARAGLDGDRSGLWFEFVRAIRHLRPRLVVVENVSNILGLGADRVLGSLAEIGYDAEWDCIPAAAVGAPHQRDRFFLVAYPNSDGDRCVPGRFIFEVGDEGGPEAWAFPWHQLGALHASVAGERLVARPDGYWQVAGRGGDVPDAESLGERADDGRRRPDGRRGVVVEGAGPGRDAVDLRQGTAGEVGLIRCDCGTAFDGTVDTPCPGCRTFRSGTITYPSGEVPHADREGLDGPEERERREPPLAGARRTLPNAHGDGDACQEQPGQLEGPRSRGPGEGSPEGIPDADGERLEAWQDGGQARTPGRPEPASEGQRGLVRAWPPEPRVRRVVDGLPHRVDRLRCLGNSVLPQCLAYIAWRIRRAYGVA